ncbi:hypothetical protein D3C87_1105710 [compost metagenome]
MKTITTDIELFAAAMSQVRVSVAIKIGDGKLQIVDYGGPIEKYSGFSVRIGGAYYAREAHEFLVREDR